MIKLTHEQWLAEATRRYGTSIRKMRFKCPSCGFVQSGQDFADLGIKPEQVARHLGFSCIGRQMPKCQDAFQGPPGPCNYAGGGLIRIAPICVELNGKEHYVFDFADEPLCDNTT